jgi:CD109 antigen
LPPEKLATARLVLRPSAILSNGQTRTLPDIIVPKQGDYLSESSSVQDELISWMERQAEDSEYQAFRTTGVYHFRVSHADRYLDGQV